MPNQHKKDMVSQLVEILNNKDAVVLVDYSGLSHTQLAEVRTKVFEAGGVLTVVKNNLFIIALKDASLPVPEQKLTGPTAVLFTTSDDPTPIKALHNQGNKLEKLEIKWGIWDKEIIDVSKVRQLAMIPGRDELLAKLVGSLRSPQTKLVYTLKGNLQKLTVVLEEIRKQKD